MKKMIIGLLALTLTGMMMLQAQEDAATPSDEQIAACAKKMGCSVEKAKECMAKKNMTEEEMAACAKKMGSKTDDKISCAEMKQNKCAQKADASNVKEAVKMKKGCCSSNKAAAE